MTAFKATLSPSEQSGMRDFVEGAGRQIRCEAESSLQTCEDGGPSIRDTEAAV